MKIGYSKYKKFSEEAREELLDFGCEVIIQESKPDENATNEILLDRPNLFEAIDSMNSGDVLVVRQLNHLAMNFLDFAQILLKLSEKGVKLISIKDEIDSDEKPDLFHITKVFSEMERKLNRDRVHLGMKIALKAKKFPGRRVNFTESHEKVMKASDLFKQGHTMVYISREAEIPRSSLYRIKELHSHLFNDQLREQAKNSK